MMKRILPTMVILAGLSSSALAHTGAGEAHGLVHGFMHPVGGLDHVLAMVAVGLFAAVIGGRALWLIPASFVSFMLLGGVLGMTGVPVPFVEAGIALSVIVLGAAVAARWQAPLAVAMAMAAVFAVFHGHAHGAEMPVAASGASYALGFLSATAMLHAAGVGLGLGLARLIDSRVTRVGGAAIVAAGVGIIAGWL
jgi:urease accessory protein